MSNTISPELMAQLMGESSDDPFLTLVTLTHASFDDVRLVNNTLDITSRSLVYQALPMKIRLPADTDDTVRSFNIEFDNVFLELIDEIRGVTDEIIVKLEMILASIPDTVQMSQENLKLQSLSYTATKITATLILDNFLNTEISSERYNPSNFPGLF